MKTFNDGHEAAAHDFQSFQYRRMEQVRSDLMKKVIEAATNLPFSEDLIQQFEFITFEMDPDKIEWLAYCGQIIGRLNFRVEQSENYSTIGVWEFLPGEPPNPHSR